MASKTVSDLKELKNITSEIKRINADCKVLRLKKKEIEDRITDYLNEVNQPGIKFGDIVVLSKESMRRKRLKKKEKEDNAVLILEDMGVLDPRKALDNILDSMKGEQIMMQSLQIKETRL